MCVAVTGPPILTAFEPVGVVWGFATSDCNVFRFQPFPFFLSTFSAQSLLYQRALLKDSSHVGSIVFAIKIIEGMCNTVGIRPLLGIATGPFSPAPDYHYLGMNFQFCDICFLFVLTDLGFSLNPILFRLRCDFLYRFCLHSCLRLCGWCGCSDCRHTQLHLIGFKFPYISIRNTLEIPLWIFK